MVIPEDIKNPRNWNPRDGTVILTEDNFIMYTFGYSHPKDLVISYLKYIPEEKLENFKIDFLDHKWKFRNITMIRPKELYSSKNFKSIRDTFKNYYPDYLYYSPFLQKEVFVVPYSHIKELFIPNKRLKFLLQKENLDSHESLALELIKLLSSSSGVQLSSFGIHGSTSYEMHSPNSDIDISVYGKDNFLTVKKAVSELVEKDIVKRAIKIPTDAYRLNRGIYSGTDFVFNAIRTLGETYNGYGHYKYEHIRRINFNARISEDKESVFRPAIYGIEDVEVFDKSIDMNLDKIRKVVSMIGEFRGLCKEGSRIEGVGMLEKVEDRKDSEIYYRIVIGSGKAKEYIKPVFPIL
ncbi:MAG: hypothetical protein GF329_09860 [Candidatus Lokiarchaeota archaeon]|nr:hypothetical protein [Candidatus Lokiarchaeota archaeon]